MAEVDTSSYPRPGQPQNPLDQILKVGQVADTLGGIEVGKGMQQAIQPDGSVDRNVLAQILKQTVAGSMAAPKAFSAIEALRNAGHAADEQAVRSQMAQVQYVANQMSPFYKKKGGVTQEDLVKIAGPTIANGTKLGVKGVIPSVAEALQKTHGMTDVQRGQWLDQHYEQGLATGRQFEAELPRGEFRSTGQRDVLVPTGTQKNPAFGTSIQQEISPNAQQPGANNQPTFRGTQPPSTGADVQMPTSGGRPVKLAQPGDGTTYGVPRGGSASPPPGFQTATEGEAQNSARMAAELQTANNEAPATKAIIGNLEKEAKNFTSGPLADYKRIGKSFAIANLPIPSSLKKEGAMFDPSSVADQESFNKNIYNLVQSQFKALGGTGTDAKLDSASHTSPSELMSQVGVKNILSLLKGNQDAIEAKTKAWNAWKKANGPQSYPEFAQDFNSKFDPRVFQFKYMDKPQRQEYFNKIDNPDERAELKRRVEYAHDAGWVKY